MKNENELKNIDVLFYDNVRGRLKPNPVMRDTIENESSKFAKYNNGISITGSISKRSQVIIIDNPTIVNGQQTVLQLIEAKSNNKLNEDLMVPVFIKHCKDENERVNIARYNNTQTQVKPIDLLSSSRSVRNIRTKLFNRLEMNDGFFLNIYSSGELSNTKVIKKIYGNKVIKLDEFIRVYMSSENYEDIPKWKNSITKMVESMFKTITTDEFEFETEKANRVAKAIVDYKKYKKDNEINNSAAVSACDLLYMYHHVNSGRDEAESFVKALIEKIMEDNDKTENFIFANIIRTNSLFTYTNKKNGALLV